MERGIAVFNCSYIFYNFYVHMVIFSETMVYNANVSVIIRIKIELPMILSNIRSVFHVET